MGSESPKASRYEIGECAHELAPEFIETPEGRIAPYLGSIRVLGDSIGIYGPYSVISGITGDEERFNIPGFSFSPKRESVSQSILCEVDNADPGIIWDPETDEAILRADIATLEQGAALSFLAQRLTEKRRQERYQYTVQGNAVVGPRGEGVLILGERGSGKTNLTLDLCRNHGCQFYANGQVMFGRKDPSVEEVFLLDGAKKLYLRLNQGDYRGLKKELLSETSVSDFDLKLITTSHNLGIPEANGEFKLGAVVVVHLDALQSSGKIVKSKKEDSLMDNLFLAEKLQRQISGVSTPLLNANNRLVALTPSFATAETRSKCVEFIHDLYTQVGIFEVSGGYVNELSEEIIAILKGDSSA